jgi:hypothetical protein
MTRYFTVEDANSLLPTIEPVLSDLQSLRERMVHIAGAVADFELLASGNGHGTDSEALKPDNDMRKLRLEIRERLQFLEEMGILVKDIEHGIVDFPARMFGREILLCWRLGEDSVGHWHDESTGFSGRRPL